MPLAVRETESSKNVRNHGSCQREGAGVGEAAHALPRVCRRTRRDAVAEVRVYARDASREPRRAGLAVTCCVMGSRSKGTRLGWVGWS